VETLHITLHPSRRLTALLASLHGGAAALLWSIPVAPLLSLAATLALAANLAWTLRRDALRLSPNAIVAVILYPDCRCEFTTRAGLTQEAELLGSSFVAPYLTILNLRPAGRRLARHAVILRDAVDGEVFRKLRVKLKWGCSEIGKGASPNC
jgi:toxin CptA